MKKSIHKIRIEFQPHECKQLRDEIYHLLKEVKPDKHFLGDLFFDSPQLFNLYQLLEIEKE